MKTKNILIACLSITLLFGQNAFAKRLGGGNSYGMQRSTPSNHQHNYTGVPMYGTGGTYAGQRQNSGMGAGTAAVLGAAAGAAGGYMLGRSANEQRVTASGVQQQEYGPNTAMSNHIPWGIIVVLAIILGFGLMLFRKNKIAPAPEPYQMGQNFNNNMFQNNSIGQNTQAVQADNPSVNPQQAQEINIMNKMPDGVETLYFLRQVKGMFLHVQSMNNQDNVSEIEKYMTPELYTSIRNSISGNTAIADFKNLDCQLLDCTHENNQLIASVKFTGLVSEDPGAPLIPFSETWNFVKTDIHSNKWLIAGIQQNA